MNSTREAIARIEQLAAELNALMTDVRAVLKKCEAKLHAFVRGQDRAQLEAIRLLTFEFKMLLAELFESYRMIDARLTAGRALMASLKRDVPGPGGDGSTQDDRTSALLATDRLLQFLESELADAAAMARTACEKLDRIVSERDLTLAASIFERLMGRVGRSSH